MSTYKSEAEILLDSLDKSVNSNTALLYFNIHSIDNFNPEKFILNQLSTGHFHFKLIESDLSRGWEHYVSQNFSKYNEETLIYLPKPGNVWNGNEKITIDYVTETEAKNRVIDLLTGNKKYFSKSVLGTNFEAPSAEAIWNNFISHIKGIKKIKSTFFLIKTDFLNTIEDYYKSDYTRPGYFENSGRDFALGILFHNIELDSLELRILLTNGYG